LTDISDEQVEKVKINTSLPGKKITSVEVLVRVENK
jgi:Fur family iron response transcriptional regulator